MYHVHNIDSSLSPVCRFCLDANEEFYHLATDCPALYWERQQIWSQDPQVDTWTPQQIIDFTYIPRINDAFVKPLFPTHDQRLHEIATQLPPPSPLADDPESSSQSDISVMDASSLDNSSSDDNMEIDPNTDVEIEF